MNRILPLLLLLAACSSPEESENQEIPEDDAGVISYDADEEPEFDFETRCDATGPLPDGTMPALDESTAPHGPDDEERLHEHMGMIGPVSYDEVTHVAVNDGHWCNPSVWHNGEVSGADAGVVIREDVHVRYDIVSDEPLFTVRVDGTLEFSSQYFSALVVDTMVVDQRGTLIMGSEDNPVQEDVRVELIFADNGDVDLEWDPQILSRGLIAHGETSIHGHRKTTHLKVAVDPEASDTLLELAETPQDWSVGDRIVIAGTRYSGWKWDNDVNEVRYHGTRDEVRTITAIDDTTITIDEALEFDHLSPRADLKTSIANFSRNVIFRNESETPEELENHHRAHMMFMHSRKADVRYAQFWHLGRTDKSFATHEVDTLDELAGIKTDSIGPNPLPSGTDRLGVEFREMIRNLERKGYYLDAEDNAWVIIEEYFSYADAVLIGDIDFANQAPITGDIEVQTSLESEIIIEVLANDTDPEDDELRVAGITPPTYGQIFDNEDGTITYRPDLGYRGEDHFKYWATDGQGNFSPAMVDISID